jgi:radical SAM superfamily enzyme YgiQ (UPF0313 family)
MHILFINPGVSRAYTGHVEAVARKGWQGARFLKRDIRRHDRSAKRVFYGLGLLTLASGLPETVEWTFVDENLEKRDLKEVYEEKPYDLVAITGQVIQRARTLELIRYFTEKETFVVVGGVHATGFWEDYRKGGVTVIIGEGEALFETFLNDFADRRPQPLYRQSPDNCIDLKISPVPDFSVISKYRYNLIGVQTTRGCPYRCRYCSVSNILGEPYRHKPVEQVREEVRRVKKIWPDSMFYFYDDNLFGDKEYAIRLFKALKNIDLGHWGVHADISVSQEPALLDLITANGRPYLAIGFETLSAKNADALGNRMKAELLSRYDEGAICLKNRGIEVAGSFMFGFPGDSESTLHQILAFIQRHGIRGYITRYTVIPGSPLYDETLAAYESEKGPSGEKGTAQARILNEYFMRRNGFGFWETEDMIIRALKASYTTGLPLPQIDALAVFRSFFS